MSLTVDDFNADKLVGFVKEYLADNPDQNPYVFIAVSINLPIPENTDDFKLSVDDMAQFFVSNILGSGELAEEFRQYNNQPQLLTTNPYKDIAAEPEISGGGDQAEVSGKAVANNMQDSSNESYDKWLDEALKSGSFNEISEKWGLWNKLTKDTLATWLRDYRKMEGKDQAVDTIKFEIAGSKYEDLVEPNPDQSSKIKKVWTRRGERLRIQLGDALNAYYRAADGKQRIREDEIMKQKMKDWDEKNQTPLEARLHQLKQKAIASKASIKGTSYFQPKHTNHVHNYIVKQKAIAGRMSKCSDMINKHCKGSGSSVEVVDQAGKALKL